MSTVRPGYRARIGWDRLLAAGCSTILLIAAVAAFFTAPPVGSAYLQFITRLGAELSLLTKDFSLAFLGNYPDLFSSFPRRALWAWGVWALVVLWPVAQLIWAIRAKDFAKSAGSWCLGMVAYLAVTCALATLILIGLMPPFLKLSSD